VAALAEQYGVPGVELGTAVISTEAVGTVPLEVARSHLLLPLSMEHGRLNLAVTNPTRKSAFDEIAFATGREVVGLVALEGPLLAAIEASHKARVAGAVCCSADGRPHPGPPVAQEVRVTVGSVAKGLELDTPEQAAVPVARPSAPPLPKHGSPRVLAVDDEEAILDLIETALKKRGVEVVRATRGRQALELLESTSPDLVLLDAMLPEIHGFELCSTIKKSERYKHIPVIIISAIYTGWNFAQDVKRLYGADDYLEKPFRVVELVRRVEDTLKLNAARPEPPDLQQAARSATLECKRAADLLRLGRAQEAEEAARRALGHMPFDARAHFILGTALQAQGHIYQAISALERVVEISPSMFSALKNLAVLYERQGFRAKAVESWMRALEQSPSDAVRQTIKAHLIGLL
jgi:DNA-binding response OmpR family regulator